MVHGDLPSAALIRTLRREHAPVVATDGAALGLRALGVLPDVIIGDLDSIGTERESFTRAGVRVIRLESQETNDLEKALLWLVEQGTVAATAIGLAGGAVDHTLNNFSVIGKFATQLRLRLRDDLSTAYLVRGSLALDVQPGDRISLIPLPSATLQTQGLAWPLHDEQLAIGVREGASNMAIAPHITIHVRQGTAILFHYPTLCITPE